MGTKPAIIQIVNHVINSTSRFAWYVNQITSFFNIYAMTAALLQALARE